MLGAWDADVFGNHLDWRFDHISSVILENHGQYSNVLCIKSALYHINLRIAQTRPSFHNHKSFVAFLVWVLWSNCWSVKNLRLAVWLNFWVLRFFLMVDKMKDDISSQHFTDSTRNFDFPTQFAFFISALLNILTMWPLCFDSETSLQTGFVAGTTVMLGRIIFISALFFFFTMCSLSRV